MPNLPPRACTSPGCPAYVTKRGRCDKHQPKAWAKQGSGSSRGYGWKWSALRRQVLERDDYLCQVCLNAKRISKANEVDHIIPKASGGRDTVGNLRAICKSCHSVKSLREAKKGRRGESESRT